MYTFVSSLLVNGQPLRVWLKVLTNFALDPNSANFFSVFAIHVMDGIAIRVSLERAIATICF